MKKRALVIVSEHPAGALVAAALSAGEKSLADTQITLVTPTRAPIWPTLWPAVVSGRLAPGSAAEPIALPARVDVRLAELLSVDPVARRIALLDAVTPREARLPELAYDELVLAPLRPVAVPADLTGALVLASEPDARRVVARVVEALELASTEESERRRTSLATVVVIGGGERGITLAGELRSLIDRLLPSYPRVSAREARVLLLERGPALLPRYPALAEAAATELGRLGVVVRTRSEITKVASDHVVADAEGETTRLETRTVLFAGGTAQSPVIERLSAFGDVTPGAGGVTPITGIRVLDLAPRAAVTGPSVARVRREASALADAIVGRPARPASARTSGFLIFGGGAVARLFGQGPTLRGGLARPLAAFDRVARDGGTAATFRAWGRHWRGDGAALLPALGPSGAGTEVFGAPPPGALPSFFNP